MGIGDYVIKLIKVAFTGCMSYANINGYLRKPIYLMRGLHQGSPLLPILFSMIAQVFSNKLKISHDITGFAIQSIDILLSLFVDDTDIFFKATSQAVVVITLVAILMQQKHVVYRKVMLRIMITSSRIFGLSMETILLSTLFLSR